MSIYAQWKPEIVSLLNEKNNSQLTTADIELELLNQDDASITVKVTPSEGSRYYGEETITYVRRDLAKAFLNIPLRIIVASDTTVGALLQKVADRFGIPFDTAVDFAQSELDKAVSFAQSGQQQVEIPAADTSFVWVGKITLTAANDGLDLESIIANINLTELKYIAISEPDTTSAALQTFPVDYSGVSGLSVLEVGSTLTEAQATDIVARTAEHEVVANEADLHTALNGGTVLAIAINEALSTATVSLKPQATYSGNAYLTYGKDDPSTVSAWQKAADDYGPGRAVLVQLLNYPLDTNFPIMGIASEDEVCGTYLDFLEPSFTPQVVPALLKCLNRVGNFGIDEAILDTIAASVSAERTEVNMVGDNVRVITFSDTQGHPEISPLVIRYKTTLNLRANSGITGGRKSLAEHPTDPIASTYMSAIMSQLYSADMPFDDDKVLSTYPNIISYIAAMGEDVTPSSNYDAWTIVRQIKSDFATPQFTGKYKQQTTFYLSPEHDQIAIVVEAVDYADDFPYRMIDDAQTLIPMELLVTSGDRTWTGEAGENVSLSSWLSGSGDHGYSAGSLVGKVMLSSLLGVHVGEMGANRQVPISPMGYPDVKMSYTQATDTLYNAILAEYPNVEDFMLAVFPTAGTGEHIRVADLYTLYDRELHNEADPSVLNDAATEKLWARIRTLNAYKYDEDFIKTPSFVVTKSASGASLELRLTGLDLVRWGDGFTSVGYATPTTVRTSELMQFKTFSNFGGMVANPDWTGKAPADALGDFLAGVRDGVITEANSFSKVAEAVVGRFGNAAMIYDTSAPDNFTGYTASVTTDVTALMSDSDYNWQKYIEKVEVIAWSKDDAVLVQFKSTLKPDVSEQVVDAGLRVLVQNLYVGQHVGIPEAVIDFTNNVFIDTTNVDWDNFRLVAGVRLDNKSFTQDALGNAKFLTNANPLPGQGTAWRISGTEA